MHFQVEFAAPVGYQEPERVGKKKEDEEDAEVNHASHYESLSFRAFSGEGNRLDGKKKKCDNLDTPAIPTVSLVLVLRRS